jgi:hypothetical protein
MPEDPPLSFVLFSNLSGHAQTMTDEDDDLLENQPAEDERPRHSQRIPCPKCGSYDFRRSNTESFRVTLNHAFGRWPFRCRNCRALFFRHGPPPADS